MATIEELVVRAKPEGVEETSDGFNEMQEELEETEEQMDDTTGGLADLAKQWKGAMGALVAGFAIATAGVLSKVPVIGEALSGLDAIATALGAQIDKELRPGLSGLTTEFFELADEIYKSEGVLDGLDTIAEKMGDLGTGAIEFTVEGDKLKGLSDDIVEFVFPRVKSNSIIDRVFNVDLSALMVMGALTAGLTMTAVKVLTFLLPATITTTGILTFMLPVIATAAVLSHLFGFHMTETAILGAIFAGVILTGALIVGSISWPVIGGAAIVGTLFAGVAITSKMVLDAIIDEDAPAAVTGKNRKLGPGLETGLVDPRKIPGLSEVFEAGRSTRDLIGGATGGMIKADGIMKVHRGERLLSESEFDRNVTTGNPLDSPPVFIDGREITNQTGRYRRDATSQRGRDS